MAFSSFVFFAVSFCFFFFSFYSFASLSFPISLFPPLLFSSTLPLSLMTIIIEERLALISSLRLSLSVI